MSCDTNKTIKFLYNLIQGNKRKTQTGIDMQNSLPGRITLDLFSLSRPEIILSSEGCYEELGHVSILLFFLCNFLHSTFLEEGSDAASSAYIFDIAFS